jgi:hypothetical protein
MGLMDTHTLTFYEPSQGTLSGGIVSAGTPVTRAGIKGSLQPMELSEKLRMLPEGINTQAAYWFLTTATLQMASEFDDTLPAYTTIRGRQFEIHSGELWLGFTSDLDYNEYILVGKGMDVEGA